MQPNPTYLTQPQIPQHNPLRAYVNNLQSKLASAKWKQNLILSYNYNPLANIKQKLQLDRATYLKRMQAEEARLLNIVESKELLKIMGELKGFKEKLVENVGTLEIQIQQQKVVVSKLKAVAQDKRLRVKAIMKANRQLLREQLKQNGIKSLRDIQKLVRSKSTLSHTKRNSFSIANTLTTNPVSAKKTNKARKLFENCLKSLSKPITQPQKQNQTQSLRDSKKSLHNSKINRQDINYQSVPVQVRKQVFTQEQIKEQNQAEPIYIPKTILTLREQNNKGKFLKLENREAQDGKQLSWADFRALGCQDITRIISMRIENLQSLSQLLFN